MPIGKSGFNLMDQRNTDSQSCRINTYDFGNTDRTYNESSATTYSHANAPGNTAIANGGAMNPTLNGRNNLHGGYGSTCYPKYFTINHWPIEKAASF